LELVVLALDRYGGCVALGSTYVVHAPLRCFAGTVSETEQGWRDAGTESYVEAVEGNRETRAHRLHVSFFAGPALEEAFYSCGGGQGCERADFGGRKKAGCDILGGAFRIYKLNIRTYARMPGEGEKSEIAGVGKIELERRPPELWGELRLTFGVVGKREFLRLGAEILREDISQSRTGGDETNAVAIKVKAARALDLVFRQWPKLRRVSIFLAGERDQPDVSFLGSECEICRRACVGRRPILLSGDPGRCDSKSPSPVNSSNRPTP